MLFTDLPTIIQSYWQENQLEIVSFATRLALIFFYFWLGKKLVPLLLGQHLNRFFKLGRNASAQRTTTLRKITKNALTYGLYFFFFYSLLSLFGFPISTLVAGAGIASVAFGMGAKEFVTDMITGFFIVSEGQFDIGDLVEIPAKGITGKVAQIGIRSTIIEGSGNHYYIPNREISIVNNLSRQPDLMTLKLPLPEGVDLSQYYDLVEQVTQDLEKTYEEFILAPGNILGLRPDPLGGYKFHVAFNLTSGSKVNLEGPFYQAYFLASQKMNAISPTNESSSQE
ncbi:TPA: mechanosensitive ion channel family protein [Streptococcus suis]